MRFTIYHTVFLPIALLTIVFGAGFLAYASQIETQELTHRLNNLQLVAASSDATDLLIRLKEEVKLNVRPLSQQTLSAAELEVLAAFPERSAEVYGDTEGFLFHVYQSTLRALQRLAGIAPAPNIYLEARIDLLTLGYNLERRRHFSQALLTFQKAQPESIEIADFVFLHSGYCFFFLGDYAASERAWRSVTSPKNKLLSEELLKWLASFSRGLSQTAKIASGLLRARRLYEILAYKESLEELARVKTPATAEYFFLRARASEGPGLYDAAKEYYSRTVSLSPQSQYAKAARGRLALVERDYQLDAKNYDDLMENTREKILTQPVAAPQRTRTIRVKTLDGSVITGKLISTAGGVHTIENTNGRFRIPNDDIESKEIVSGN